MYFDNDRHADAIVSQEVAMRVDYGGYYNTIVDVKVSPIFKFPKEIVLVNSNQVHYTEVAENVFFIWFMPLVFTLPIFWIVYRQKTQPMIVLANSIIFIYPFVLAIHMFMTLSYRTIMIESML